MSFLLIANLISFVSACFTIASSWTKDPHRTYWYQIWQCLAYALAAYFFGVYSTIVMMVINAFRNYLISAEKYSVKWMLLCSISSLIVGLIINGHSIPGYLSVFMTVYYTISSFYLKKPIAVKVNVAFDIFMWFIYDLFVCDIPSGIVDITSVILAVITIFRIKMDARRSPGVSEN